MLSLKVNLNKYSPTNIKFIAGALKKGQVLALPTDTIYGLSCLANDEKAIKKIKKIKKNDQNKPLSILVSDLAMLNKYVYLSADQKNKLEKIWQPAARPTTVILKHRRKLPAVLTGKSDGLAARLPKLDFLIKILEEVKQPIVSTSLNISGQPVINNLKNLDKYFLEKSNRPDLIVDAGICRRQKASRILDLREDTKSFILRK